ncbi:hypothetical protein Pmani_035690, partial [Petrolisthes manimaculis]
ISLLQICGYEVPHNDDNNRSGRFPHLYSTKTTVREWMYRCSNGRGEGRLTYRRYSQTRESSRLGYYQRRRNDRRRW